MISNAPAVFGALELTAKTCAIITITLVLLVAISALLYAMDLMVMAIFAHLLGVAASTILIVTWLTSLNQSQWADTGPFPVVGAVMIAAAVLVLPYWAKELDL